jgi:hypothetical protein
MRAVALLLALVVPAPVTAIGATSNTDGSVTIFWTLPADPSVVGVTVFRERLDLLEPIFRIDLGLDSSFTDFSTDINGAYRYAVQTRDFSGDLSAALFVEVFPAGLTAFDDSSGASWVCVSGTVSAESALWPLALSLVLLAFSFRKADR